MDDIKKKKKIQEFFCCERKDIEDLSTPIFLIPFCS